MVKPSGTNINKTSRVVIKEPGYHHGWPSVALTEDGTWVVVFSGRRHQHVCPFGKTLLVRSEDHGITWSAPDVVNNTPLDDRDPGLLILSDGTWLLTWFTSIAFIEWQDICRKHYGDAEVESWQESILAANEDVRGKWLGAWSRRSTDQGHTWGPPVKTHASSPHGPIEISDGRLIYVGGGEVTSATAIGVMNSMDQGRSWTHCAQIKIPQGTQKGWYSEPHAAETIDGRIVCLFRFEIPEKEQNKTSFKHDFMMQTESRDGGRNWSELHQTPIKCHPPHIIRLHNNSLLAVYSGRYAPYGQKGCISCDNGKTWDVQHEILICDDAPPESDLGYPASIQLPDNSIYTVYYQVDQPGEKTCIIGTHWYLSD
ncbi:MAG: sialidase family protein [Candidatus Anammoxibacter sp.]